MTLYKYLTSERSDILETGHIRYTQPIHLNDPFEMTPDFSAILTEKAIMKLMTRKQMREALDKALMKVPERFRTRIKILAKLVLLFQGWQINRNMTTMMASVMAQLRAEAPEIMQKTIRMKSGVLSLSEKPDNLLMWSHYALNHTGFVIAVNEKHSVFNERRSVNDEFNHLRKVVYSKKKPKPTLEQISGIELLLSKSLDWSYEQEWRIVKPVDDATAMGTALSHDVYLFPLPPDAIEGIILGAHMPESERQRIIKLVHSRPDLDHTWMKQAEVSSTDFALSLFRLPGYVEKYPEPTAQFAFSDVVDTRVKEIADNFNAVASIVYKQPLNLSRLKTVHISPDIAKAISQFLPGVIAGDKEAQVYGFAVPPDVDVVMFLSEDIFPDFASGNKKDIEAFVHKLHRQLGHVHNVTERFHLLGEKALTEEKPGTTGYLAPIAFGVWNDYIVSRLSAGTQPLPATANILPELMRLRTKCADTVTAAIAAYQTHRNTRRLLMHAAVEIQDLLCAFASALGYADGRGDALGELIEKSVLIVGMKPYDGIVRDLMRALRRMYRYYPAWEDFSIYDDLMHVVRMLALVWGLPMRDFRKGIHVAIMRDR